MRRRASPIPGPDNEFTIHIKATNYIYLEPLLRYLKGEYEWDESVLQALNFFDHCLREKPSKDMVAIKRNFYSRDSATMKFEWGGVEAAKGIYMAFRLSDTVKQGGTGLAVNVDVANTAFWTSQTIDALINNYMGSCHKDWKNLTPFQISDLFHAVEWDDHRSGRREWVMSDAFKCLRRLHKLKFHVRHRGTTNEGKVYTIQKFAFDPKYGRRGANSQNVKFVIKKTGEERSVRAHYKRQYSINLNSWRMPVIQTTRDGYFPVEICHLLQWQRYNFKLDSSQTQQMIKFAVTRPQERSRHIMANVAQLGWDTDPYLRELGIKMNKNMAEVSAKIIDPPEVQYANGRVNPGTKGSWDLRGRQFIAGNSAPLDSWAVVQCTSRIDEPSARRFGSALAQAYKGTWREVQQGAVIHLLHRRERRQQSRPRGLQGNGRHFGMKPVMMIFIFADKDVFNYNGTRRAWSAASAS